MNYKERFDKNLIRQQTMSSLFNELGNQRDRLMEDLRRLEGEQRLLNELMKEEANGRVGGPVEKTGEGTTSDTPANHP